MKKWTSYKFSFDLRCSGFWYIFSITLIMQIVGTVSNLDHDDSPGIGMIGAPFILPALAAIITVVTILLCKFFGLILRKSPLNIIWNKMGYSVLIISFASLLCLIFSKRLGLNQICIDYKGCKYSTIRDIPMITLYILMVFPIVNLPFFVKRLSQMPPPIPR